MICRPFKTTSLLLRGAIGLAGTAFWLTPIAARGEPLPKEACDVLASEYDKLVAAGVKGWMAEGAQEARKRLGADKLGQIARFLEVDEQLLFRCGLYRARSALPADVEEPPAEQPAPIVKPPPATREKAVSAPNGKPKAEPDRKKANQATAAPEAIEPAPAKPAAKKKTKPDDAFRPAAPAGVD